MKKLLALLLVLAMVFAMMTFLTACGDDEDTDDDKSDKNDKDDDDDKKNDDEDKDDGDDDDKKGALSFELEGLTLYAPKGYDDTDSSDDGWMMFGSFEVIINVSHKSADFESSEEGAEFYADGMEKTFPDATVEMDEKNDIYYVIFQEEDEVSAKIVAYYVKGDDMWIINADIGDLEKYGDEAIDVITSGEID